MNCKSSLFIVSFYFVKGEKCCTGLRDFLIIWAVHVKILQEFQFRMQFRYGKILLTINILFFLVVCQRTSNVSHWPFLSFLVDRPKRWSAASSNSFGVCQWDKNILKIPSERISDEFPSEFFFIKRRKPTSYCYFKLSWRLKYGFQMIWALHISFSANSIAVES